MKLTFEGTYFNDILNQIAELLEAQRPAEPTKPQGPGPKTNVSPTEPFAGPVENPADNPVEKTTKKTGKVRSAKQLENDERLRKLAVEKAAAKKTTKAPVADEPEPAPAPKAAAAPVDPADLIKTRIKTIAELQEAYANGQQEAVFTLLSKFGNGAKSFRELPAEAFGPIREAIDAGALA